MTDNDRDLWLGVAIGAIAVLALWKSNRRNGCGGCSKGPATVIPFPARTGGASPPITAPAARPCGGTPPADVYGLLAGFGDYNQGPGPISPVEFHG